jgi:hypothetical protein
LILARHSTALTLPIRILTALSLPVWILLTLPLGILLTLPVGILLSRARALVTLFALRLLLVLVAWVVRVVLHCFSPVWFQHPFVK